MIVFSDIHFHNWAEFSRPWKKGLGTRVRDQLKVLTEIFALTQTPGRKSETILFLGDWYQNWNSIHTNLHAVVTDHLYDLLEQYPDVDLVMLPGNHDMPDKSSAECLTFSSYSAHPRITVVQEADSYEIEGTPWGLVPFSEDPTVLIEALCEFLETGVRHLGGHLDIAGASASIDGYVAKRGWSLDIFEEFDLALFGHYHQPQRWFGPETDRNPYGVCRYVGGPIQLNRVDSGQDRGVVGVYDEDDYCGAENGSIPIVIDSPRFVMLQGMVNTDTLRDRDYHYVACDRNDAHDLMRYYENAGLKALPLLRDDKKSRNEEDSVPISPGNVIDSYVTSKNSSTLRQELLRSIGQSYLSQSS